VSLTRIWPTAPPVPRHVDHPTETFGPSHLEGLSWSCLEKAYLLSKQTSSLLSCLTTSTSYCQRQEQSCQNFTYHRRGSHCIFGTPHNHQTLTKVQLLVLASSLIDIDNFSSTDYYTDNTFYTDLQYHLSRPSHLFLEKVIGSFTSLTGYKIKSQHRRRMTRIENRYSVILSRYKKIPITKANLTISQSETAPVQSTAISSKGAKTYKTYQISTLSTHDVNQKSILRITFLVQKIANNKYQLKHPKKVVVYSPCTIHGTFPKGAKTYGTY
jgi:hypothetical protein